MAEDDGKGATPTVEELQRKVIELQDRVRDTQHEAKEHRLARNKFRARVEELERAQPADASAELERLRGEVRGLKHRGVFERVAREAGAKTTGKALDTLWDALEYDPKGDADPADLKAKVEAARADYDFLFEAPATTPGAPATTPPATTPPATTPAPPRPAAPPKPAGPGSTRGAAADDAGATTLRKSDLQSFDPAVNPMMDRHKAAAIEAAKRAGTLRYIDE